MAALKSAALPASPYELAELAAPALLAMGVKPKAKQSIYELAALAAPALAGVKFETPVILPSAPSPVRKEAAPRKKPGRRARRRRSFRLEHSDQKKRQRLLNVIARAQAELVALGLH